MINSISENRDEKGRVVVDEVVTKERQRQEAEAKKMGATTEDVLDENLQNQHIEKLQAEQAQLRERLERFRNAFWTQHQRVLAAFEQDRQAARNIRKP